MEFDGTQKTIGRGKYYEIVLYHGYAYKIYDPDYPEDWVTHEKWDQAKVNKVGLTPVKYYDTDDPHIIKMDHIEAEPLEVRANARDLTCFDMMADAFRKLYKHDNWTVTVGNLSYYGEHMPDNEKRELVYKSDGRLDRKYGHCLCHFNLDLHNILAKPGSGDYIILDWVKCCIAPPLFDYAKTYMLLDESYPEHLAVYKERVLPDMWALGVTEEDFDDALKICSLIRDNEGKYDQLMFGYKKELKEKIRQLGFDPSGTVRDRMKIFYPDIPTKEMIKDLLMLLTNRQQLVFWDKDYGVSIHDPGRYIDVIVLGDHVVYDYSNHGWSSGYYKASFDEMADLIRKNWAEADGLLPLNFDHYVTIHANPYFLRDEHFYVNAK
ncbi:MAG: hypothetical protein J6X33_06555 [Clostridiales bacterium]|nr:hypothetical protein [Clostridiales bacterium]